MDPGPSRSPYFTSKNKLPSLINDKPLYSLESFCNSSDPQPSTSQKIQKKSIVITNSNLSASSHSQSLCRIGFQNKICLALPPGITWEEINAPPLNDIEISNLLHYTTQLNYQLKKKKKRMKIYRNDVAPMDKQYSKYHDTRNYPPAPPRNNFGRKVNACETKSSAQSLNGNKNVPNMNISELKSKPSRLKAKKCALEVNKVVDANESDCVSIDKNSQLMSNTSPESVKKLVENIAELHNADANEECDIIRNEILKLREPECTNMEIIEALKKYNILSLTSPFATDSCRPVKSTFRANPINFNFRKQDSKSSDAKIKKLMKEPWTGSDDGNEVEISKAIYEELANEAEEFRKNSTDSLSKKKPKKKKKKADTNKVDEIIHKPAKLVAEESIEFFEDYYEDSKIEDGLKNGTMFQEILRINLKNWREAFISCSVDDKDIFIDGIKNRNRALEGDEVVVELLPQNQSEVSVGNSQKPAPRKYGKVVRIIKESHPRTAIGSLKHIFRKKKFNLIHCPIDARLPRIKILLKRCPEHLQFNYLKFDVVYTAKITNWEHTANAEGILLTAVGNEADLSVETECILFDNRLDVTPFEGAREFLPPLPYQIPVDEIDRRVDIRYDCVFTIDPPSAKDLDDALSCNILPNGNIEVGIHIADVTHFLKPDTPLDLNARAKATSVYLTETVFHMLPFELCQLCSLTPGEDKLAFSVFVEFDQEANVISHRFSKTMLRSCVQLTYAHAQDVIDNFSESYEPTSFPPVMNGFTANDCVEKIRMLQTLAVHMRKRRFTGGALKIDQPKVVFKLDEEGMPYSFSLYTGQECNWLIEEFMLLANILAANKTLESFPEIALLRYHASPKEKYLSSAVEYLEKVGICIDMKDAGTIYRSMMQYEGFDEIGTARMAVITNFLVKPMVKALYACASKGDNKSNEFWHYALNTPCYTHFTSPIRRYPDVIVHRLLAASLGHEEAPKFTPDEVQEIANNCNAKKNSSKKASETSTELYLKIYLEKYGSLKVRAVVLDVKERQFEFIDLNTRTLNRIYVNKIQEVINVEFKNESMPSLKVTWKNEPEPLEQIIQIFTMVDVELSFKKKCGQRLLNSINAELLKPMT